MKNLLSNKILLCLLLCLCHIGCSSNSTETKICQELNINNILNLIAEDEQFNLFCCKFHIDNVDFPVNSVVYPDSNNNIIIKNIPATTLTSQEKTNLELSIIEFVSNVYLVEIKIPYENAHLNYVVENANDSISILGHQMYEI